MYSWRTMHVCRSAAAAEREQWRHREVQSSGCCSHGTARGREGKGRVSYRIGYSNLGFGQGRGRDLIPRSACLGSPPSPPLLFGPKMFRQVSHFLPPSSSLRSTPASLRCLLSLLSFSHANTTRLFVALALLQKVNQNAAASPRHA